MSFCDDLIIRDTEVDLGLCGAWLQSSGLIEFHNSIFTACSYGALVNMSLCIAFEECAFESNLYVGIYAFYVDDMYLHRNVFEFNPLGIQFQYVTDGELTENSFYNNSQIALQVSFGCTGFLVYDNTFADNLQHAADYGSGNNWDDTVSIGNIWDDYIGYGTYAIPGTAGSVDHFPRSFIPPEPPTLDHPADITYVQGTIGHSITWHPSSGSPASFVIYRNGTLCGSGPWIGGPLQISVDGYLSGAYNFTIVVYDMGERNATDTVWVFVTESATTSTTTTTTTTTTTEMDFVMIMALLVTAGSACVIVVVVVLFTRSRTK
ncbi:MAG: hypothetical protein EAX95_15330 [Candidatus Thorarchaeota archaeon]|nr:hypothetical protein [Candidatus Thorarchaeota archaeon]